MDLKLAMLERIKSMQDKGPWEFSLGMSRESMDKISAKHDLAKINHVYLVGCGTSMANALIGESFIEEIAHVSAEAEHAFHFSEYVPAELLDEHALVLGVTGAGVTTSVEQGLKLAREAGALTIAVTGSKDGKCSLAAEEILLCDALNEGPTVRTTSNIYLQLALYVFAVGLGVAKGTISAAKKAEWDAKLDLLISQVKDVLGLEDQLKQLAEKYHALHGEMVIVLGTGANYGTAWEGSLMAVEMGWVDSAGYELEEFTHGRFRECDETKPLLFIAPYGKSTQKLGSILEACNKANAPAVLITDGLPDAIQKRAADIVLMPGDIPEVLTPLLYIFPLWLFDYYTGIARGVDPAGQRYGITAVDINRA